jgi:hypothetical protein
MRRALRRAILSLVLGAATTVAVAWSFAIIAAATPVDSPAMLLKRAPVGGDSRWLDDIRSWAPPGETDWSWSAATAVGWERRNYYPISPKDSIGGSGHPTLSQVFTGWPAHALTHEHYLRPPPLFGPLTYEAKGAVAIELGTRQSGPPRIIELPIRPLWPGFFFDMIFYGVVWLGLLFRFTSARRGLWRRRGRCAACGYDLRRHSAGDRCPECGTNVQTHTRTHAQSGAASATTVAPPA